MRNIDLESDRLRYKRVTAEHITDTYVNWMNDNEVNAYLESGGNYTLDMLKAYVDEQYKKEVFFWAIHLKTSDKHIGNIKIDPIKWDAKSGEYGILMGDRSNWGKGYATEATRTIISYCFDKLKLETITLGVVEANVNAVALYKKMGFKIDEVVKNTKRYKGKISNSLRMSLNV